MVHSFAFVLLFLLPSSAFASRHDHRQNHNHEHVSARQLPGSWFHRDDHPVRALFRRADATDGVAYPAVGSQEWKSAYPSQWGPPAKIPDTWAAALKAAIERKAIPDIPVAQVDKNAPDGGGTPAYPKEFDPNGPIVCSATYKCRIPGDIWDAPDGQLALSFDDGPTQASDELLDFLIANKQTATHFMIGSNLLDNPKQFLKTFSTNGDIAVHTWSHQYTTTLSNEQVVAELGWTMQLIHDSTGGRVPRYWRPPYGDSDCRTRAIAKEVFGLTTVIWNQDTADWSLASTPPGTTLAKINASMTEWLKTKSPGLVILEHETSSLSVQAFKAAYPVMKETQWKVVSLSQMFGNGTGYWNAADNLSPVKPVVNLVDATKANAGPVSSSSRPAASTPTGQVFNNNKNASPSSKPSPSPSAKSSATLQTVSPRTILLSLFFVSLFA
ncbi:Carbohydrate esterase family 4 protein [Mycena indigotica]|uniref:chitin deacetylase n=1 Tax=Mycena indigotica TaxID=2126181 RepID=A0A8H6TC49_9AGAR|nr:Carbohydrate esterase family 4 protein [Mycena indigotica]KAF7314978.1 Carbohydrate esterase family 4 protein [Mycena indigotica]